MKRMGVIPVVGMLVSIIFLTGCASFYPGGPVPVGSLFTSVRSPVQNLGLTLDATAKPTKKGVASAASVLGLIATGDASVDAAMKNGGITRIHHVDHEVNSFLFIYASDTTIVYGE